MEEGLCDGLLLAYAGVHRMGYDDMIAQHLDLDQFIPAVGQGSVAIESSKNLDSVLRRQIIEACNHEETASRLRAERAFLRVLEGGCSIPVFALARLEKGQLVLGGGIVSLDGVQRITFEVNGPTSDPESLGQELAQQVLAAGGKEILEQIKKNSF
jgi:hydroxymethylbilane synthase